MSPNRELHILGRRETVALLTQRWQHVREFHDNRIAVRFQCERHDAAGQGYRSYGNELWGFTPHGLMSRRGR